MTGSRLKFDSGQADEGIYFAATADEELLAHIGKLAPQS